MIDASTLRASRAKSVQGKSNCPRLRIRLTSRVCFLPVYLLLASWCSTTPWIRKRESESCADSAEASPSVNTVNQPHLISREHSRSMDPLVVRSSSLGMDEAIHINIRDGTEIIRSIHRRYPKKAHPPLHSNVS
jgi:hypothetical protein